MSHETINAKPIRRSSSKEAVKLAAPCFGFVIGSEGLDLYAESAVLGQLGVGVIYRGGL